MKILFTKTTNMNYLFMAIFTLLSSCGKQQNNKPTTMPEILYTVPAESDLHEGNMVTMASSISIWYFIS